LKKEDLKWKAMESTTVETQTFYLMSDEGKMASIQIIYNNVAFVHSARHTGSEIQADIK
jgi:hypothetical protein